MTIRPKYILLCATRNRQKGVLLLLYALNKCFIPPVVTETCFTVKSADSGIQNSADGSREKLTKTPSDNSLADAGETEALTHRHSRHRLNIGGPRRKRETENG